MQFDKDLNSEQAELFLDLRKFISTCIGDDLDERYRDNITSYYSKEGGFCYLKTYHSYVHIGGLEVFILKINIISYLVKAKQ